MLSVSVVVLKVSVVVKNEVVVIETPLDEMVLVDESVTVIVK